MKRTQARTVRLDIASRFEMLEMVQTVLTHVTTMLHLDDDSAHYVSVAIRESVVNAIKHGNRGDAEKRVAVEFLLHPGALEVTVQDEGPGFDPGSVPNPLEEQNLLKADGRGIFFMRSFMDEVSYAFPARGGTVVRMLKKLPVAQPR
jgi:serine/threonine-protein kinase RsbW